METRKKYKIALSEKYVRKSENGNEWFQFPINVSGQLVAIQTIIPLDPYTEPDLEKVRKEAFEEGKKQAKVQAELDVCHDIEKVAKANYQQGLNDAWDTMRKIRGMTWNEQREVFGTDYFTDIIALPASECIEKIRHYEQEKDRQARIEYNFDEIKDVFETTAKECNVSLDEIAEVLQKMKETDNG